MNLTSIQHNKGNYMKIVLILISVLFVAQTSFASVLSCEDQIEIEMSQLVGDTLKTRTIKLVTDFETHSVYRVVVGANYEDGLVGIPYVATYKVLVLKDELGSCTFLDVVLETEAQ